MDYSLIEKISRESYPNILEKRIPYGTAGFRTSAELLNHVLFRMGVLAALRSRHCRAAIGLMITGSHNDEPDNGVKLVDPHGEMLETVWEKIADNVANVKDENLIQTLKDLIKEYSIDESAKAVVIVGRDTRKSGDTLMKAAVQGIEAADATAKNFDIITTPQLHYLVFCTNIKSYGEPTVDGYIRKLSNAFVDNKNGEKKNYQREVYVDAANGVGAIAAREFGKHIEKVLKINIFNDGSGLLNHKCGADYVKIHQAPPLNNPSKSNAKCVSIDGDADRVIYYYIDEANKFHMLDGDKIATVIVNYLKELITLSRLSISLGLVQTAYANGASSAYATEILKVPVAFTETGVKHLHHRAQEFDVGVYFEANGHGTVIFRDDVVKKINSTAVDQNVSEEARVAAAKLRNLIDTINQTVGDALSDMLLIETILYEKDWSIETWEKIYTDLPNKQVKVKVQDRTAIKTTDAERQCTAPDGLQFKINDIVTRYSKARSFVRPSGTEDIVRVYAECEDSNEVNKLAAEVAAEVHCLADGVGPEPEAPK